MLFEIPTHDPRLPPSDPPWPPQGQWTYEDYLRLPDDGRRYEIIDGVLYVTNAPDWLHQRIVMRLGAHVENLLTGLGRGEAVIPAPFEVHLPGHAKPVLPDLLYIAPEHCPNEPPKFFEGAPDLVVEIISPSSVRLDRYVKFGAYERAGVREYWLIDLGTRSLEVYVLSAGEYALLGQFGPQETARSQVLPELTMAVGSLFET
ncbi:MAG: Uma2 family endonuclease [Chloroflexi bacterium]|nr:Uma2 family endonuclease [Chloroflexota bacterium]